MAAETLSRDEIVGTVHERGFVPVPLSLVQADIDQIFDDFMTVAGEVFEHKTTGGQDILNALTVQHPGRQHDSNGFLDRRVKGAINPYEPDRGPGDDNKDILHVTTLTSDHAHNYMLFRGGMPYVLGRLLKNCTQLDMAVRSTLRATLEPLEIADMFLTKEGALDEEVRVSRLLNYHGSPEDADDVFLGEDHFDRSRFTIAGEENRPGLHGAVAANSVFQPGLTHEELDAYSAQARATPIDYQPGVGKFFVGAGFAYMDSSAQHAAGNMRPLLHGVDNLTPGVPRRAFVSFINERLGTPNLLIPTLYETKLRSVHAAIDDPTLITEGLAKQLTDARRTVPGYPLASLVADQQ